MLCRKQIQITTLVISGSISVILIVYFSNMLTNNYYTNTIRKASGCKYVGYALPKLPFRLGNHLFFYSGVMYVAWLTGRRQCIWIKPSSRDRRLLDEVFDFDIEYINVSTLGCPFHRFRHKGVFAYDKRVDSLIGISDSESLLLAGHFGSWKYTQPIESQLRRHLRFRQELIEFVADFLAGSVPPGWTTLTFVRVGVHVRRGDFLSPWAKSWGFTVVNERYLRRAMNYFVERFTRVQFIVASNDIKWCQKHVKLSTFNSPDVNITFSVNHNTGQDLALLASCDHTVMTSGTYGWWAAWLANGTTVYYSNFPKPGSSLSNHTRNNEFYRPDWVGIDD